MGPNHAGSVAPGERCRTNAAATARPNKNYFLNSQGNRPAWGQMLGTYTWGQTAGDKAAGDTTEPLWIHQHETSLHGVPPACLGDGPTQLLVHATRIEQNFYQLRCQHAGKTQ